jgi:transmembrane sensor
MNIEKEEFLKILEKYRAGLASAAEEEFLDAYYNWFDTEEDILQQLSAEEKDKLKNSIRAEMKIHTGQQNTIPRTKRWYPRFAAAAVLLLISSGLCLYAYRSLNSITNKNGVLTQVKSIVPGGNKATLTLADGSSILLQDKKNGVLAQQGNIAVRKTRDGELVYQTNETGGGTGALSPLELNTITTPRGGQYQLTLPDGSKVWLNSASSIRFPVAFNANERKVEITGEAYFEVKKLANGAGKVPFLVVSPQQVIEVLGTHFNVNAYEDEGETKTTLLEGSVRVTAGTQKDPKILKPGQRAVIRSSDHTISIQDADIETAVAWKNGYFKFDRQDLQSILRQVSRWYDVDIVYKGKVSEDEYVGKIKRSENVSGVLRVLELSKVNFRVEGRRISVNN